MKVKELIKELQKYSEDTEVFTEYHSDDYGITYINEPGLDFKEEIEYNVEEDGRKTYANYLRHDGVMNNVLFIN